MSELFLLTGGMFPIEGPFFLMVGFFSYKKICGRPSPHPPPPPHKMSHSPLSAPSFFKMLPPPIFVYLRISWFTSISAHLSSSDLHSLSWVADKWGMSYVPLVTQDLYTIVYNHLDYQLPDIGHDDSSLKRLESYEQPSLSVKHVWIFILIPRFGLTSITFRLITNVSYLLTCTSVPCYSFMRVI